MLQNIARPLGASRAAAPSGPHARRERNVGRPVLRTLNDAALQGPLRAAAEKYLALRIDRAGGSVSTAVTAPSVAATADVSSWRC